MIASSASVNMDIHANYLQRILTCCLHVAYILLTELILYSPTLCSAVYSMAISIRRESQPELIFQKNNNSRLIYKQTSTEKDTKKHERSLSLVLPKQEIPHRLS